MILPFAKRILRIVCGLFVLACPFAAAFAQSSSSSDQSSSSTQQSSAPAQTPSQAQPAALEPPPAKQDSLAEAARKAKANKPASAKVKVYTEDDLKSMKGPGVSVVGDPPRKGPRGAQPAEPDDDSGQNPEAYWRGRAQQFLDAIAQIDEQIAQKKEEIKKFGSGGFDVTTGMKNNIAYINDRNAQLKQLEARKADLEKQFEELQDEGRKAGAPSSWFR
jgi:DNA repair exonuclease SbcCD ATPase subunit